MVSVGVWYGCVGGGVVRRCRLWTSSSIGTRMFAVYFFNIQVRALKKRIEELQSSIQAAQRQQRQREREMKQVESLNTEIEEYKKHKVCFCVSC